MRSLDEVKLRDKDAENYDKWYTERGANAVFSEDETIISKLNISSNVSTFLDFGSGTGRFTVKIYDRYPHIKCYALDISPKSIEVLNDKNKNIETSIFDASIENITELGYPKFDRILSMQMVQHLEKDGAIHAINEMYYSLNDAGCAVIELYNYSGFNRIIERIRAFGKIKKIQKNGLFFEYRYSADEFKNFILKYSDFKDVEIYGCQNISRRFINKFSFLIKFDLWLSKFELSKYLGYYFIAVCKK